MNDEQLIRKIVRDELASFLRADKFVFQRPIQIADGNDILLGKTNGTRVGKSSTEKLSFYGATPIVRQTAPTSPSGGLTVDQPARNAIDEIRAVLTNLGLTS